MPADRLSRSALNRATLDRQLLLRRTAMPAHQAVRHLGGLQAQAPLAPYVGLWTRLAGFGPAELEDLFTERSLVRAHVMRNTVHLLTAADFVSFRPLFQPLLERRLAGTFGRSLAGVDLAQLRETADVLLAERPLTRVQLGEQLAAHWPEHDQASLAYAATHLVPLVQVPPRGRWSKSGQATFFLAAAWLADLDLSNADPAADPAAADPAAAGSAAAVSQLVLRYLGAFGPASVNDVQAWSGLTRLREVTERLGDRLRTFTGPDGEPLLDLPDAPRPDPGVPAPPRFLPEYDNLLVAFADRSRVIPHTRPVPLRPGTGASTGTLLVDGQWQASWKITKTSGQAVLHIQPFRRLSPGDIDAISAEGGALLEFAGPAGAARDVQFAPVD
jgi:hypothetical protein